MIRIAIAAAILAASLPGAPAFALTAKEKMDTCKFGAADQKLKGAQERDFIKKCMASEDAPAKAKAKPKPKPTPK
jgi:hypothetical protein